jgi:hypothetical protein
VESYPTVSSEVPPEVRGGALMPKGGEHMLTAMKKMLILASAIAICGGIGFAVDDPSGTGSHAVSTRSIKITGVTIPHVA